MVAHRVAIIGQIMALTVHKCAELLLRCAVLSMVQRARGCVAGCAPDAHSASIVPALSAARWGRMSPALCACNTLSN
jgi:hypothetical protein